VLGLRLVKTMVNFDDPGTYHLYYGNESGQPGTLITFFPWPGAPQGRRGAGQATTVAFSIPEGSTGWWHAHLERLAADVGAVVTRAGEEALSLSDPDGLVLELVSHPEADPRPPRGAAPARRLLSVVAGQAEPVAAAQHCLDDLRAARVFLDLAAQVLHVRVDGAFVALELMPPDPVDQLEP
jgi:catechol 2,3-dioxygenase-like lactoylglutathione lyase family enzyme